MNRVTPILELSEKEFLYFFKLGNRTGGQLTYRINWLIKKVTELGLNIIIKRKNTKFIVGIHQKYLGGRQLQNPLYTEDSIVVGQNCLVDKEKYIEDDERIDNMNRLKNKKGYIYYYFTSEIKTFIFSLIKKYYNDTNKQ